MSVELGDGVFDARYWRREKQVRNILDIAISEIEIQNGSVENLKPVQLLAAALITPPTLFSILLSREGLSEKGFFEVIAPEVIVATANGKTLEILSGLLYACRSGNRKITEAAIDSVNLVLPRSIQVIYAHDPKALEEVVAQGASQAAINTLRLVQGEIPLIRYRRDLAEARIPLTPSFNGGQICSIATKIPNVDLRYFYPRKARTPNLSFVVNPFI